tara:strand:+ start:18 stop:542 length:525 start_codon:yes stop_codon:yes gene_type:complete
MSSSSTSRVRKQCFLPECSNRPLDNGLCEVHNQEHLSAEQEIFKPKRQRKTTKDKYKGNKISKKMKKQKSSTPSPIHLPQMTQETIKTIQPKRKPIPIPTKTFNICIFPKCMFLADMSHRCNYHKTFKKCMFPGCYKEKQKNSGKCKTHNHFKLCRKKHCYIYDGIGDYCRIHT